MSAAGVARIVSLVEGLNADLSGTGSRRDRFVYHRAADGPLEEMVGRTRLFEVDDSGESRDLGLTGVQPVLYEKALSVRVRYEVPGPTDEARIRELMDGDARLIQRTLRLPSSWAGAVDQMICRSSGQVYRIESAAQQVANRTVVGFVKEIPVRIQFYEED